MIDSHQSGVFGDLALLMAEMTLANETMLFSSSTAVNLSGTQVLLGILVIFL